MDFELTILGSGAALPARGRYPSAQLLNMGGQYFLIDCGEGTQSRLRSGGHNMQKISRIFISHLHGDHYLGLMGLISSMHLLGRNKELHVHGPAELEAIIRIQLDASGTFLRYPLTFHTVDWRSGEVIFEDENRRVTSLALKHRVKCTGFRFDEHSLRRKLNKDKLHLIPHYSRRSVQEGQDLVQDDGSVIPNEELTLGDPWCRSYAYCSDTAYNEDLVTYLSKVDLLYHEATFAEELAKRASETQHSTAKQAAMIASRAQVKTLILGHFSSRYKDTEVLRSEAMEVFPNTLLAEEGRLYSLDEQGIVKK